MSRRRSLDGFGGAQEEEQRKEQARIDRLIAKAVTKERIGNVLDRFAKESTEMGVLVADNDEYIKAVLRKALGE